jgi:hypothetical protein
MSGFLLHPQDNVLDEVSRSYRIAKRLKDVEKVLDGRAGLKPEKVFRSHLTKDDDIIEQPDITYRVSLDLLLGGLSALHIGGLNATPKDRLNDAVCERIGRLLEHRAIHAYYVRYYPYAPPILVSRGIAGQLPDRYIRGWQDELDRPGFNGSYRRFLTLDARFIANTVIGDFIELLDDYVVGDVHITDLRWALAKPERLKKWLRKRSHLRLVDGMQSFLAFAHDLDAFLSTLAEWPVLRGHVWLHFAYWFGTGGDRMVQVAEWLQDAVAQTHSEYADGSADQLRRALIRLRDASGYPAEILAMLDRPLAEWRQSADLNVAALAGEAVRAPIQPLSRDYN